MAKRRGRGEGSIHQRPDGRWVGQINVSPPGAVRRRKTVYGATRAEVRRKLDEAKEQHKQGNYTTSSMKFEAWLDYWLEKVVKVAPGTKRTYERQVRLYIKPALGGVRLDQMNLDHPERLAESLSHVGSGTRQQAHRTAGNAMQAAMQRGLTTRNPFKITKAPEAKRARRRALSNSEFKQLMAKIKDRPAESRWMMAVLLGARQGECLGLTWDRVDFDDLVIDVEWQAQRIPYAHGCTDAKPCGYKRAYRCYGRRIDAPDDFDYEVIHSNICWVKPKTDRSRRIVPIPQIMVAPLRRRYVEYLEQRLADDFTDHGLVFARANGEPLDDREDYWSWRALLDEAGIAKLALHGARNSAATKLLRDGIDVMVIREILGHSDIVTTQSYQRADLTLARKALDS